MRAVAGRDGRRLQLRCRRQWRRLHFGWYWLRVPRRHHRRRPWGGVRRSRRRQHGGKHGVRAHDDAAAGYLAEAAQEGAGGGGVSGAALAVHHAGHTPQRHLGEAQGSFGDWEDEKRFYATPVYPRLAV